MPVCRQCGKQWPDGYAVCPDDGNRISVMSGTALAATGALAMAPAAVADEDLPAGSQCGEYIVERKIGEGGMGAVYGARHPVIGKRAAIKVIKRELSASAEGVDRFVREAQAVNTIGHPNIVDVFGFGRLPDGRSFFVMEWLEGESLRERMQRPLAFAQALEVLESIATALQAAHEAGVVHRDLKPDNVYLQRTKGAPTPRVKLLDFGLAKLQGSGNDGGMNHTRTGVVMGTPLYLSPEQAKGEKVDFATDIYSLGAMAYEMGAGVVPFVAGSAVEIMAQHISARALPMTQRAAWIPPAFEQLVDRMLWKDPRSRPTVAEVVEQLQLMRSQPAVANAAPVGGSSHAAWTPQVAEGARTPVPMAAPAAPAISAPGKKSRSGLVIALVAGVVLVAGGAIALVAMGGGKDKKETVAKATQPMNTVAGDPTQPEPVKTEPVKTEPVKTEPATAGSAEPAKTEPAKTEPAKTEPAKTEPAKTEPVKTEPVKTLPVAHPRVGTLSLTITGAPRGTVWIDGKQMAVEVADFALDLPPGEHKVRVQAPGHKPYVEMIKLEPGVKKTVSVVLKKQSINTVHDPFAD